MPRKIEPAVQTITFSGLTVPASAVANWTIDLSQCASLINRRFYRQGLNWVVGSFKFVSAQNQQSFLQIFKLPETWIMSNAWEKGFRTWQKMNKESLEESESVRPKFLDFKIYADQTHHTDGYAANLMPFAHTPPAAEAWAPSKVVIPKTDGTDDVVNREILAVGASYPGAGASGFNAVSLIEGYAASRGLPDVLDPNAPVDAASTSQGGGINAQNWLAAIFNEGTDQDREVLEDMITENNLAPYPFENDGTFVDTMYPGGANQAAILQIHDQEYQSSTTIGGVSMLKGGSFPCGLVRISATNLSDEEDAGYTLQINMVPGPHRGYMAMPMTEM